MSSARDVVEEIRTNLRELDDAIRNHVYPDRLRRKQISTEGLRAFTAHQYAIVTSDLRSIAILVNRFGDGPSRDFFMRVLEGERSALQGLLVMAEKLEMSESELQRYPLLADGFAYTAFMAWQALYTSAAEFTAGILVNFPAWGHNCGRMSAALKESYGFSAADTVFLDAFANMPPFEEVALEIIQDGLDHGVDPLLLHRSAELFQGFERMFWDFAASVG